MRRTRVCIYGGTDLQGMMAEFISELAYQVLDSMLAVIVCGGFRHSNEKPNAVSTDVAALRGAERYEVDAKAGTVTHILDGAISPADVGRRLTRRFHVERNTLTISFEPGASESPGLTRTLVWRRVSS